jgi:phosphoribosyl 1,2-cyclic phosphodiesterase
VKEAREIDAAKTYFVHMSHELLHESMLKQLPSNMKPAYDGLKITL